MKSCTFIDGVASSQAIDTAGEIVDLKGLDISSLVGAAYNWEHLKDQPSQIVGKILEAKKIFSRDDCENERHLYYWNKIQIPFLYVMGRLFDDKKPSAVEVAALFKDDAEHPAEHPMVGFSIEGARLGEKMGMVVPRSIARKVTITNTNANKTCAAELLPPKKEPKDELDSLFKGDMELFDFGPKAKLAKKEAGNALPGGIGDKTKPEDVDQEQLKMGIEHELEHTKDEKIAREIALDHLTEDPHYYTKLKSVEKSEKWTSKLHSTGIDHSHKAHGTVGIKKIPIGSSHQFEIRHNNKLIGASPNVKHASTAAKKYMHSLNKAMEAGSGNAAPNQLVQGAALGKESLEGNMQKMHKKERSSGYKEADQAYSGWEKREEFRSYMKKRMPHLAAGEVDAIGRILAFKQSKDKKKKISSMYAGTVVAAPASTAAPAAGAASGGGLAMSEKKK